MRNSFPSDFYFGAATSSYQIEGAWNEDGKGESVWDRFAHTPGTIEDGSNGDVACDHYHRWPADVDLMHGLGLNAYRFSISWPRILPTGRGAANQAGIDFYSRLVDGLLEAGITPFPTLFHWDLPQALQEQGGFAGRATCQAFCEYADAITRALGDRVKHWMTLNEPSVYAFCGHGIGIHAPGLTDFSLAAPVSHHQLLAHGMAVPVIRANCAGAQVGTAININYSEPASPSAADYDAWRSESGHYWRMYIDPLYGRHYPADAVAEMQQAAGLPWVQPGARLNKAARMAERKGARIMGLGAFTSVIGDAGITVANESDIAIIMNNKYHILSKDHVAFNPYTAKQFRDWVVFTVEKNRAGRAMQDMEFQLHGQHFAFDPRGLCVVITLTGRERDLASLEKVAI